MKNRQVVSVKEFASLIGADHANVSRYATRGIIKVVSRATNSRGPGSRLLDRGHSYWRFPQLIPYRGHQTIFNVPRDVVAEQIALAQEVRDG